MCVYILCLAQLDLLVLFSQGLCQLGVALCNEVKDQVSSSVSEHSSGGRGEAQRLETRQDSQQHTM